MLNYLAVLLLPGYNQPNGFQLQGLNLMLAVIGSKDHFLGDNLGRLVDAAGLRKIRTVKVERVIKELKQPDRLLILDVAWKELQQGGLLRRLVNIANISGNKVVCICPNEDEKLKKFAKAVRPSEVFIRYDLELGFRDFLEELGREAGKPKK